MSKNDVTIVRNPYGSALSTLEFPVQDRTSSGDTQLLAGEPVKISGAEGGNYATHLAAGDPEIGTDIMLGIVAEDSTETSTADGVVQVYEPLPGVVYRCLATTSGNLASGIIFDTVTFDGSAAAGYTVDEDELSDENVHGLRIVAYDAAAGTVDFMIKPSATFLDCNVA